MPHDLPPDPTRTANGRLTARFRALIFFPVSCLVTLLSSSPVLAAPSVPGPWVDGLLAQAFMTGPSVGSEQLEPCEADELWVEADELWVWEGPDRRLGPEAFSSGWTTRLQAGFSPLESGAGFYFRVGQDLKDLLRMPKHMKPRHWRRFGWTLLAVGLTHGADEQILSWMSDGAQGSRELAHAVKPLGQEEGLAVLGAAWL